MTTLKGKQTVTQSVELEVPDYFTYDDTKRGEAVNALLKLQNYRSDYRDNLFDDKWEIVCQTAETLTGMYSMVDAVIKVMSEA